MARPAKDRPGRSAWLGPAALGLSLISWLIPFGEALAAVAIASGGASIATRRQYAVDWAAIAGVCIAVLHLYLALTFLLMDSQH